MSPSSSGGFGCFLPVSCSAYSSTPKTESVLLPTVGRLSSDDTAVYPTTKNSSSYRVIILKIFAGLTKQKVKFFPEFVLYQVHYTNTALSSLNYPSALRSKHNLRCSIKMISSYRNCLMYSQRHWNVRKILKTTATSETIVCKICKTTSTVLPHIRGVNQRARYRMPAEVSLHVTATWNKSCSSGSEKLGRTPQAPKFGITLFIYSLTFNQFELAAQWVHYLVEMWCQQWSLKTDCQETMF
jgi:hypothetical protein